MEEVPSTSQAEASPNRKSPKGKAKSKGPNAPSNIMTSTAKKSNKRKFDDLAGPEMQVKRAKIHHSAIASKKQKYQKGPAPKSSVADLRVRQKLRHNEHVVATSTEQLARSEILLESTAGFLEPEAPYEKTWRVTQEDIKESVNALARDKIFELTLNEFGPYKCEYSSNGQFILLSGEKGHVAMMNWQKSTLTTELHLQETVYDAKFLHNETMFAVAQKRNVYVYDKTGSEIHCLTKHKQAFCLEYLPYHFLLSSVGMGGFLRYQDISTGEFVVERKTKLGHCQVMRQNPHNAILHLGHHSGTVSLWSPNVATPLVQIFCHQGPVKDLAIDRSGLIMATAGLDGTIKVFDIRTYKELQVYKTPSRHAITSIDISQRGLLALSYGSSIQVWRDFVREKPKEPYMSHRTPGNVIERVRFCPYEDILGIGYENGFSSVGIPGAGEPNFDSFTANVFQTKKTRREATVQNLLQKIPADMIVLDPTQIGTISKLGALQHSKLQKQAFDTEAEAAGVNRIKKEKAPKAKMKGKNKIGKRVAKKEAGNAERGKALLKQSLLEKEKESKVEEEVDSAPPALSRFAKKKSSEK